jgi:cyclopropane fatty-acyl-phospholipid synthase-like methyltransferase
LNDKTILEVGCGRGGGLSYISRYLNPKEVYGVDFSDNQVIFCKNTY